jgi:Mrp family chromosome partitioning ATPase
MHDERRRYPRIPVAGKDVLVLPNASRLGSGIACELRDISLGGVRCAAPHSMVFRGGADLYIELVVPTWWSHRRLRLPVRAVRSGPGSSVHAFELLATARPREARHFEAFVHRAAAASHRMLLERRSIDRQIEDALYMAQLGLSHHGGARPRIVMLTSPSAADAKAFLTAGLAVVLARQEATIAVDLDCADPALHRLFDVGMSPGAADWFQAGAQVSDLAGLLRPGIGGVRVLPAGRGDAPRIAAGRAATGALVEALRQTDAQSVLINAPPCLVAADAGLLSEVADDALLVLSSGVSTEHEVVEARSLLDRHNAPVRGVILTDFRDSLTPGSFEGLSARWRFGAGPAGGRESGASILGRSDRRAGELDSVLSHGWRSNQRTAER